MKKCRECGLPIYGRSDKRFCDDGCRNAFHNRRAQGINRELQGTHRKLLRNFRLLQDYESSGINRVRLEELLRQGFDPESCTGLKTAKIRGKRRRSFWSKKTGGTGRYRLIYTLAFRVEKGVVLISSFGS
ncbi:hypothetical protein SAMN04490243_0857 [Robiginitalea myxolifaciens]|uniref:DUF2116 family Zn-ribbon domain-containing protein n=1 Tax=Robiginitalea myxolifaciens TaxID=400055 RepID=A0A1I6FXE4_9FLAO|nr:hypothetical protein [Robiginitalea myxolifaciens]SFR34603.1 hypothetical protein SAMN04490243_0857 [Robiginitalea myxolifaciens]